MGCVQALPQTHSHPLHFPLKQVKVLMTATCQTQWPPSTAPSPDHTAVHTLYRL